MSQIVLPAAPIPTASAGAFVEESAPPRGREWAAIAGAAVLLRALLFAIVALRGHISLGKYAQLYDGRSYLITARAISGDRSEFNDYHGRVFPGFPALVSAAHLSGLPFAAAAVGIDWATAAAAAVLAAALFADRRIGWAMAILIPHYLMNSAMALSEAPLLAFTLAGLLLARRRRAVIGGALVGFAGLIRPMACFALAAGAFAQIRDRRAMTRDHTPDASHPDPKAIEPNRARAETPLRSAALFAFSAAAVVLAGLLLLHYWRGDALANARYYATSPNAYGGELFTWPFHALLTIPRERHVPPIRVAYIWAHALIALAACIVMARRFTRRANALDWRDALAGPWLWGNTLFALCIGSVWGFECFHRFTIPALPAMFWALRPLLPRRRGPWVIVAAVSLLIAAGTVLRDLR